MVSHDQALLELMDRIGDLRDGEVSWYGGGYSAYRAQVEAEQRAAEQAVVTARADLRKQRRDRDEAERVLAQRKRYGKKMYENKREPRAVMKMRKREQQVSASKYRKVHDDRLDEARERLETAETRLRDDREIRIDLPGTEVPRGRTVLTASALRLRTGQELDLELRGPERIALVGPNGSGKTTLLHTLAGHLGPVTGTVELKVPFGLLPQRLDVLDESLSVFANVAGKAPAPTRTPYGPGSRAFSSVEPRQTRPPARCPEVSGSERRWPPCFWPIRRRSCCSSTSRPTTWTSRRTTPWCPPWRPTKVR